MKHTSIQACPVCNKIQKTGHGKYFPYQRCTQCQSLYIPILPDTKTIRKGIDAWARKEVRHDIPVEFSKIILDRINILLRQQNLRPQLIDVGCGAGAFLFAAKKNGFSVSGMDVALPVLNNLRKHGIRMYGSLTAIPARSYPFVTCFDVIEHTTNPLAFVGQLSRICTYGGVLIITTPNAGSISQKILGRHWWVLGPEGHYVLFTVSSLERLLKNSGFCVISTRTDTITSWFQPADNIFNRILNKIVYVFIRPFQSFIFSRNCGDNIEIVAQQTKQ